MAKITDKSRFLTLECDYRRLAGDMPRYTISYVEEGHRPQIAAVFDAECVWPALDYIRAIDKWVEMFAVGQTTTLYILSDAADIGRVQADVLGHEHPETAPEATLAE